MRDEGPDSEDLLVCDATMRLPGAVPAYACHDVFDCMEVLANARRIPASTIPQNFVEGIIAMAKSSVAPDLRSIFTILTWCI